MDIVLIRHGESEANLINQENYSVFTGQWECSLTEKGIEQAKKLKDNPILKGVERYYVSDSLRAQETASYFAEKNEIVLFSYLTYVYHSLYTKITSKFFGRRNIEDKSSPM